MKFSSDNPVADGFITTIPRKTRKPRKPSKEVPLQMLLDVLDRTASSVSVLGCPVPSCPHLLALLPLLSATLCLINDFALAQNKGRVGSALAAFQHRNLLITSKKVL